MESGKREDPPKILQTKLNEQKGDWHEKAIAKASTPPKAAESIVPPPTVTLASAATPISKLAVASVQEGKESERDTQKAKQPDAGVVPVELDAESDTGLMSD